MTYFGKTLFLLVFTIIVLKFVRTDDRPPDMCLHSSRLDSLTQYMGIDKNNSARLRYFFTSHSYYWLLSNREYPTANNSRGKLPHGFRGDASYFRRLKRCEDNKSVFPILIVVDNTDGPKLNYLMYDILNNSWSQRLTIETNFDPILEKLQEVYKESIKSIDTIINFSNIKVGPYGNRLGEEFLFILTTAHNGDMFYHSILLHHGCVLSNGTSEGLATSIRGYPLEPVLWKMNQSVDAAMLYISYPPSKLNDTPTEADISLFEGNTHFQFTVSLESIEERYFNINRNELLGQYYSTWMGCAVGETPEPPFNPNDPNGKRTTVVGQNGTVDGSGGDSSETTNWRPTITHEKEIHSGHEDDGTFVISIISGLIVFTVGSVILTIISLMFCFKKDTKNKTED